MSARHTSSQLCKTLVSRSADTKILLLVVDGLGGLPDPDTGLSELDTAVLPNLDRLAAASCCGLHTPIAPGITPGSGAAHLGLFGYDPLEFEIGRGALSALGLGLDFKEGDVAIRLNFCSVDPAGLVLDRRAGRISTETCREMCGLLKQIAIPNVQIEVTPEQDYRAVVKLRGAGLHAGVSDSDPQAIGVSPMELKPLAEEAKRTVEVANEFLRQAKMLLANERPANMVLMRGFGSHPELPQFPDIYGLKALAVAGYPMYRGVAAAVGMDTVAPGNELGTACQALTERFSDYDFAYIHVKSTDTAGEDGDFDRKVALLEEVDSIVPRLEALAADVLVITGDHSTPSIMRSHSWHPVPCLISSTRVLPVAGVTFSERGCAIGSLGHIKSTSLMSFALAHAGRLAKFGP
jgi:2,3-bisphosphoglycerate-independent phosphoglycerate mutase